MISPGARHRLLRNLPPTQKRIRVDGREATTPRARTEGDHGHGGAFDRYH